MIELLLNIDKYINPNAYLSETQLALVKISISNKNSVLKDNKIAFMKEAIHGLKEGVWGHTLFVLVIANALEISIQQIYPTNDINNNQHHLA